MKIARVFPVRTSMTPTDTDAYFREPNFPDLMPPYDEVHISCQFTWDIEKAKRLKRAWEVYFRNVKLGGVAIDGESKEPFQPGMYLKSGVTITTRGCPNKKAGRCPFCMVNGYFTEFDTFPSGNINQDNNILACSKLGWSRRMEMFSKERNIEFKGGLDKYRITPKIADDLRSLSIKTLWLACDQLNGIEPLRRAVTILNNVGFTRSHLYCYVLIGDNARENIHRLREVWKIGCMPFAQLHKPKEYPKSWNNFQRRWDKPAIIRSRMRGLYERP